MHDKQVAVACCCAIDLPVKTTYIILQDRLRHWETWFVSNELLGKM